MWTVESIEASLPKLDASQFIDSYGHGRRIGSPSGLVLELCFIAQFILMGMVMSNNPGWNCSALYFLVIQICILQFNGHALF